MRSSSHPVTTNVDNISTSVDAQADILGSMATRVQALAHAARFNAKTLGERLGIPSSSAANYWSGKRPWPVEFIPQLADLLDTNVEFLLRGVAGAVGDRKLSFHGAQPQQRTDMVELGQIDLSYGLGAAVMDEEIGEHQIDRMAFPRTWLRMVTTSAPDQLVWARGAGNSMEPSIHDGEVILIDRSQQSLLAGDLIWACAYGQSGMVKRLRQMPDGSVKILSDNPSVPPEVAYDGELTIFGRVVAVVKRL